MPRIVLLVSFFLVLSPLSRAANRIVQNTSDSGSGSFREAVQGAADGDTVRFNPALIANGSVTILLLSEVTLKRGLVIKGLYSAKDTLYLSGNNTNRILNVSLDSASVKSLTLDSLVFIHGYSSAGGGAVSFIKGTELNLKNCRLFSNDAASGGGIYINSSVLTQVNVLNTLIDSNYASSGGAGICVNSTGSCMMSIENSGLLNNRSNGAGGGIYCYVGDSAEVRLTSTVIKGNRSINDGAGLYVNSYYFANRVILNESTIEDNEAVLGSGGGIYSNSQSNFATISSSVSATNSSISENTARYPGGGIYCYSTLEASIALMDCRLAGNSTMSYGGGIYVYSYNRSATVLVNKSSVTGNSASYGGGIYSYSSSGSSSFPSSVTIINSTIANNEATSLYGGGIYSYAETFSASIITITNSTLANNKVEYDGSAVYAYGKSFSRIFVTNSTIANNTEKFTDAAINNSSSTSALIEVKGSIFLHNSKNLINKQNSSNVNITSLGYNIFSDSPAGNSAQDMLNANPTSVKLGPLENNGGPALTMVPLLGSIAIDKGDSADHSPAQNGFFTGIRDIGAAESCISAVARNVSACNQYVYNGITYTNSAIFYDSLISHQGCDSVITTHLTVFHPDSLEQTISACDSFVVGSVTYFASGTYHDTLSTAAGCDSFITTHLTILPSASSTQDVTACFFAVINGKTYNSSQKIVDRLTGMAANGCDSVVTTNLTINKIDIGTTVNGDTLGSKEALATYQWLDCANALAPIANETGRLFIPTKSGNYAVEVNLNNCVDTSVCVQFIRTSEPELFSNQIFRVYPNPSTGYFNLTFERLQPSIDVTITTVSGQVIASHHFFNLLETTLRIPGEAGLYFIEITDSSGVRLLTRVVKTN